MIVLGMIAFGCAVLSLCGVLILQRDMGTAPLWARILFSAASFFGAFSAIGVLSIVAGYSRYGESAAFILAIFIDLVALCAIARAISPQSMPNPFADGRNRK